MLVINKSQLPADEAAIRAALADYKAALEAHKATEGVPAPFPSHDFLFVVMQNGGDFEVVDDDPVPLPPPTPTQVALAAARQALSQNVLVTEFEDNLRGRSVAEISAYVDNQVTDIASARLMFKRVLAVLSRIV